MVRDDLEILLLILSKFKLITFYCPEIIRKPNDFREYKNSFIHLTHFGPMFSFYTP